MVYHRCYAFFLFILPYKTAIVEKRNINVCVIPRHQVDLSYVLRPRTLAPKLRAASVVMITLV